MFPRDIIDGLVSSPQLVSSLSGEKQKVIPGPKTNSVEMIGKLRKAGMNIVRMNFSHGSYEVLASNSPPVDKTLTDGIVPSKCD
jgi:hypothetical protein